MEPPERSRRLLIPWNQHFIYCLHFWFTFWPSQIPLTHQLKLVALKKICSQNLEVFSRKNRKEAISLKKFFWQTFWWENMPGICYWSSSCNLVDGTKNPRWWCGRTCSVIKLLMVTKHTSNHSDAGAMTWLLTFSTACLFKPIT